MKRLLLAHLAPLLALALVPSLNGQDIPPADAPPPPPPSGEEAAPPPPPPGKPDGMDEENAPPHHKKGPGKVKTAPGKLRKKDGPQAAGKPSPAERQAAREQREKKLLERFDKDGDGTLSEDEKAAVAADREARLLERFDADGDGKLSSEERVAMRPLAGKPRPGAEGRPPGKLGEKPAEHNADKEDAAGRKGPHAEGKKPPHNKGPRGHRPGPEAREKLMARFDTDGDGKLSEAERAALKEAREKTRANRPGKKPRAQKE